MQKKRVHFLVAGRVQGVFFRANTKDIADQLGLSGWVRNLVDGRVEGCIEGEEAQLDTMLRWLQEGSPPAVVTRLDYHPQPTVEQSDTFNVIATASAPLACCS